MNSADFRLASLHGHMSQFLIISLLHSIDFVSLENPDQGHTTSFLESDKVVQIRFSGVSLPGLRTSRW